MKRKLKTKSATLPVDVESDEEMVAESTELNGSTDKNIEAVDVPSADDNDDDDDDEMDLTNFKAGAKATVQPKKRKKGIIYISNIPKHMNVTRLREILGEFGKIGRVYLQPEKQPGEL